ncbi:MAG: hypothetical protein LBS99_03370 [Clostridiales bacterium]|jgi:hypothetical protein|nr:hypothetical protein [Clostridiales bacterium]
MTAKKYTNAGVALLEDYIPLKNFRTITLKQLTVQGGYSEYGVEIEVTPEFSRSLNVSVDWDGRIYGFTHGAGALTALMHRLDGDNAAKGKVYLNDWGDNKFLLLAANHDESNEQAFFVTSGEVKNLLDNCMCGKDV